MGQQEKDPGPPQKQAQDLESPLPSDRGGQQGPHDQRAYKQHSPIDHLAGIDDGALSVRVHHHKDRRRTDKDKAAAQSGPKGQENSDMV